jgi:hypothetical protein
MSNQIQRRGDFIPTSISFIPTTTNLVFLNRWGPEGWFTWFFNGDVPGSKGNKYIPEGYTFQEIGPRLMKNKGEAETRAWEEKLMDERPAGCPFSFSR